MRARALRSVLLAVAVVVGPIACDDSSSGGAPGTTNDGGGPAGDGGGPTADGGGPTDDGGGGATGCDIENPAYAVAGGPFLWATTQDVKFSKRIATINAPGGAQLTGKVLFAKTTNGQLVVSADNCRLCKVDPAGVSNGVVTAELLKADVQPRLLGDVNDAANPDTVILVSNVAGGDFFEAFSLTTKTIVAGTKLDFNSTGMFCNGGVLDLEGKLTAGMYALDVLITCGDGNSGAQPAFIHSEGFLAPPAAPTRSLHEVIAWAKNSATSTPVERMKVSPQIFTSPPKSTYKLGAMKDFVLENPSPYETCSAVGTRVPGIPIF